MTAPARFRAQGLALTASVCLMLLAGLIDAGWGIAAGFGRGFFLSPGRQTLLNRLSGSVLIGGGLWLSLARRPV